MTVVYAENFMAFVDGNEFKRLAPMIGWKVGSNFSGMFRRAANTGPFKTRPSAIVGAGGNPSPLYTAAYLDKSAAPGDRCAHFRFRVASGYIGAQGRIGLTDESVINMSSISQNQHALEIEIAWNAANATNPTPVRVYHRVPTSAAGNSVNSILLGEIPGVLGDMSYTVETRVHLDGVNSRLDITWNGMLYQFPFNPSRLATTWEAKSFNVVSFYTENTIFIGDFVVYRDDASTTYPLGGVNVDVIEPVEAKLKISELNDLTSITLANDALVPIPMTAFAGSGEVLDIRAIARVAAGTGDQPIRAEMVATRGGESHTFFDAAIPVGASVQLVHAKLPDSFRAEPNDIVIAARGKPGV